MKNEKLKKWAYLSVYLLPGIYLLSLYWVSFSGRDSWLVFSGLTFVYILVPLLDIGLGRDEVNPSPEEEQRLNGEMYYKFLTLLSLPVFTICIYGGAYFFVNTELTGWESVGLILSAGTVGAVIAINVGHELIHKSGRLEPFVGGLLYAMVCYSGFKIEHLRGHHVWVSTPQDPSSAPRGMNLYRFLPKAIVTNFANAFRLEAKRLKRVKKPSWSLHNEAINWLLLSIAIAVSMYLLFGGMGLLFFLLQSFVAIVSLEIINYIEHYGLERKLQENGRYERTTVRHSWNSSFFLTNLLLFQLQRHSDHHAFPQRRYQILRHHDESPQLPAGYAAMVLLALVPPLWRRVMDPKVNAYYQ